MKKGSVVVTKDGEVGRVFEIKGERVLVEIDWQYLVEYKASELKNKVAFTDKE